MWYPNFPNFARFFKVPDNSNISFLDFSNHFSLPLGVLKVVIPLTYSTDVYVNETGLRLNLPFLNQLIVPLQKLLTRIHELNKILTAEQLSS